MQCDFAQELPFAEEYKKLEILVDQGLFELLLPEKGREKSTLGEYRLVYLMNDAAESFLVFTEAELRGSCLPEDEGELEASLERNEDRYVLIVRRGERVFTLFFRNLMLETHLFHYGRTGHFWVRKYEDLRQLEYRIAILRDKRRYLGEEFCTEEERKLSSLAEFPPLNACCYPAVPKKYLSLSKDCWKASGEALQEAADLAAQAGDEGMVRWIHRYGRIGGRCFAKWIAFLFRTEKHEKTVDLITRKLLHEAATYPERVFAEAEEQEYRALRNKAKIRKEQLEKAGETVELLIEEPFLYAKDDVEYKVHLMIRKRAGWRRWVEVETFEREDRTER